MPFSASCAPVTAGDCERRVLQVLLTELRGDYHFLQRIARRVLRQSDSRIEQAPARRDQERRRNGPPYTTPVLHEVLPLLVSSQYQVASIFWLCSPRTRYS